MTWRVASTLALALLVCACSGQRYDQTLCLLVDVSGTYADERSEVARIVKREILPAMLPGDTFMLIRIDSESYDPKNVETLVTLDTRPSRANAQKLAIAETMDRFAAQELGSQYTDIPGAIMLGAEYLRERASRSRVMLIFSDLREDLPAGASRRLDPSELDGVHVVAMNVKRLRDDNSDPGGFRARLASWEQRVADAHALDWRTVLDPERLPGFLASVR